MEESQEILVNSLESLGISIPQNVSSVKDFDPTTLVSICTQCLNLLDPTASFPSSSLPSDSMADQFKICTDLATRIKNLGFVGDMSFHKVSQSMNYECFFFIFVFLDVMLGFGTWVLFGWSENLGKEKALTVYNWIKVD